MDLRGMLVALFAAVGLIVYLLAMRASPGRGWLRVCEKGFTGLIVLFLVNLALAPLAIRIAQTPLSSLAAGYLGLPGAALIYATQRLP